MPMPHPLPDLDIASLIILYRKTEGEHREAARRARFEAARSTPGKLLAMGVLTTADDEMEASFAYERRSAEAKARGVPMTQIEDEDRQRRAIRNIQSYLREASTYGETEAERSERIRVAHEAAVGFRPGSGRRCTHQPTKQKPGWMSRYGGYNMLATDEHGDMVHVCTHCGATVTLPGKPPTPTADAARAAGLLLLLPDPQGPVDGLLLDERIPAGGFPGEK